MSKVHHFDTLKKKKVKNHKIISESKWHTYYHILSYVTKTWTTLSLWGLFIIINVVLEVTNLSNTTENNDFKRVGGALYQSALS